MKKLTILSLLIISFSFCRAQVSYIMQNTDYRVHDGFFLSLSCGPNSSEISVEVKGQNDVNYSGTGPVFDLKIGGAIKENLILHATLTTNYVAGPELITNGVSQHTSNNLLIGEDFIGGGITYYIMPSNTFLSGSLGFGNFRIMDTDAETSGTSDKGFGMQLKVGKEWWVSKRWGLGIALTYAKTKLTNTPGGAVEELMNSNNYGIHFNATLN
jgi:hypothetical protein